MTPDDPRDSPSRAEFDRRRRQRSIVTGFILVGLVALFYLITIAKIGSGA